jgi:hypothetical protein
MLSQAIVHLRGIRFRFMSGGQMELLSANPRDGDKVCSLYGVQCRFVVRS